ncbi:Protein Hook-like protein 3-like [Oopsacas minuta]|uniref:Protein Hook-like protein 3-like n=1 Tax=Oopsacas minuta TaxID=111878 RepID=A0AAV7K4J7_9METZ|nr:Protein Hook-like protein 3-like [Oopsacas minuta]
MSSLLAWLCTFPHCNNITKFESLTDGRILALSLHRIDPAFFTKEWLVQIAEVGESNTQLKQRNIGKIVKSVVDYNREVLQVSNTSIGNLNVVEIVNGSNHQDLCQLILALLNIAVNCEKKEEHVSRIMQLDSAVQKDIMEILQEGMEVQEIVREANNHVDIHWDLEMVTKERDILFQESTHKETALKSMEEEKDALQCELDRFREQVSSLEEKSHRCVELEIQVEQLQDDLTSLHRSRVELETSVEELKIKNENLEHDLGISQDKNIDYHNKQSEMEHMRDKLDEMPQLELKLANYEKKLLRLENDNRNVLLLKENLVFLQNKNKKLIQEKLNMEKGMKELEEKRFHSLQQNEQLQLMQSEINEYKTSLTQAERQLINSEEQASSLQNDLRKITEERDNLLCALTSTPEDPNLLSLEASLLPGDRLDSITEVFTPEMKERLARLESDNSELRRKIQLTSSSSKVEGGDEIEAERSLSPGNIEVFEKELQIDELKNELSSRNKEVSKLKNYLVKMKKIKIKPEKDEVMPPRMDHEDRLVMASWYRMGLEVHNRADLYKAPAAGNNTRVGQDVANMKYDSTPKKDIELPPLKPQEPNDQ